MTDPSHARRARLLLLALFALSFTGCYATEVSGDTATIRFNWCRGPCWSCSRWE